MTRSSQVTLKGSVVVQKKNALDLTDIGADIIDDAVDLLGRKVKLQLVCEQLDPATGSGKLSPEVAIGGWYKIDGLTAGDIKYDISFTVDTGAAKSTRRRRKIVVESEFECSDIEEVEGSIDSSVDLSSLTIARLRGIAKSKGLRGYSRLKKAELVALLLSQQ